MEKNYPRVGLGIMILKDGKVLMGKRKGKLATGLYAFPGGSLEYGETLEEGALREIKEECGLEVENFKFQLVGNFIKTYAPSHWVQINFVCDWKSGEPQNLEPEKCEGWDWYEMDNLPQPVLPNSMLSIESFKTGKMYFDKD